MMPTETAEALGSGLTPTETPVLEVRGLSKRFPVGEMLTPKYVHSFGKMSRFAIGYGEIVALVGESGSGNPRLPACLPCPDAAYRGRNLV